MNEHFIEITNTNPQINTNDIIELLKTIYDPEIEYSIYDIGLIYKINISNSIDITMTLTSANCPEADMIPENVKETISHYYPDNQVSVKIVFDPPWTVDNMTDEIQLKLGLL